MQNFSNPISMIKVPLFSVHSFSRQFSPSLSFERLFQALQREDGNETSRENSARVSSRRRHPSFLRFLRKKKGQSIARAWNFEIGHFIRECSRMWEENDCYVLPSPSTENSASLPIGITSWKIDKTHVHEARESKARKGGCSSSASRRNPKRQEITRSSRPSSRREPSSLERLWNNAKSLSTLICQTIALVSSFPSLPPSCGISRQGIDSHSLPDSFPFFSFFFFFIPRIIDRFFRIYLPYKYNVVEELIDEIIGTRKVFLFFKIDAFKIGRKHYRTRFRLNKDCINLPQFRHLHRNQKNIYIYISRSASFIGIFFLPFFSPECVYARAC